MGALFVVTVLLAAGVAIFLTGHWATWGAYRITVQFADVGGLAIGTSVRLAGVEIGKVGEVRLRPHKDFPGRAAAVTLYIERDTPLYTSDGFSIREGSLVGDQYVAVERKLKERKREKLQANSVVGGGESVSTEVVMRDAKALIADTRAAIASARVLLDDSQMREDLRGTMANLNRATARATEVAGQALRLASSLARTGEHSESRVTALLDHLVGAAEDISSAAGRVDKLIAASPMPAQLAAAGDNIHAATVDIAAIAADARSMIEDSEMGEQVTRSVKNLREASDSLRQLSSDAADLIGDERIAADLRQTLENVRKAAESLQKVSEHTEELMTDPKTTEDVRASLDNLRAATDAGRQAAERADDVFDHIERSMESIRQTQSMLREMEGRTRLQMRAARDDGLRADLHLDIRTSPDTTDYWRVGIRDLGAGERLDLQWSHPFGHSWVRPGVFDNQLGIGYDYGWGRGGVFEAELYNPNDLRLDVRGRWHFQEAYDLLLGVEHLFEQNDPYVGLRWEPEF